MNNDTVVVIFRCAIHPVVKQCIDYNIEKNINLKIFLLVQKECVEVYEEYNKYNNFHMIVVDNGFFEFNKIKMNSEIENIFPYKNTMIYVPTRNLTYRAGNIEEICFKLLHSPKIFYYDDVGSIRKQRIFGSMPIIELKKELQNKATLFWERAIFRIYCGRN